MSEENTPEKIPEANQGKQPRSRSADDHWLMDWVATLGTVFLSGAALCSFMRWSAGGYPWDLGGMLFSGVAAWISYRFTLSDNALSDLRLRQFLAFGLPVFWGVFFPVLMMGLGFK